MRKSAEGNLSAELRSRTEVPIILPAELPDNLKNVAVDDSLSGNRYGVAFFVEPQDDVVESWSRTVVYGTMQTTPVDEAVSNEYFEATSADEVQLPDGSTATLRLLSPVDDQSGTQGEYWEGKFQRDSNEYSLIFLNPERVPKDEVVQVLSSMVSVPDSTESTPAPESEEYTAEEQVSDEGQEIQDFVFEYYAAVEQQDWTTTYYLLADDSQAEFTEEEWIELQEIRQATDGGFSSLESAEIETIDGVGAIVSLYFSDGTTGETTLNYLPSSQEWRRYLTDEDISYLDDLLSEESEPDTSVDTSSVEQFVYDYYAAVESEDWSATYSILSYDSQQQFTEDEWIERQETRQEASGTPASVSSVDVSVEEDYAVNPIATATATFTDGTSLDILVVDPHSPTGLERVLTDEEIEYLRGL